MAVESVAKFVVVVDKELQLAVELE